MCRRLLLFAVGVVCLVGVVGVSPAFAESAWWKLATSSTPAVWTPGGEGKVIVEASNLGDAATGGAPTTITVSLPSWLTPVAVLGIDGPAHGDGEGFLGDMSCEITSVLSCTTGGSIAAYGTLEMFVTVKVAPDAPASGAGVATIEGGETPSVTDDHTFTTGPSTPFGVERYELAPESEGGAPDTQAGSHPFQLTSTVALNQKVQVGSIPPLLPQNPELVKDLHVKLPPGLVGNANLLPQCGERQFAVNSNADINECPASTAVGVALVTINEPRTLHYKTNPEPIFNLTPNPGEPARFGFTVEGVPVVLDTSVRTGSDYGVTVSVNNLAEVDDFVKSETVFWGVPGAPQHYASRGWSCVAGGFWITQNAPNEGCGIQEPSPKAFLTLPTSCAGPLQSSVEIDSWNHPGQFTEPTGYTFANEAGTPLGLTGCNRLGFEPSISVAPDGEQASTPTGLTVGVHVPQEVSVDGAGIAEADVRSTTVTLPAGVQLSPSAADGLQACSDAQIGFTGFAELDPSGEPGVRTARFTPDEQTCPDASKVATVKIKTPLLANPLEGAVYLAAPQNFAGLPENPFESLVAMYIVARDPVSGVLVKLPGKVTPDPVTGQLVSTFENTPQLPFEQLELHFFGTDRAPLATPALCRRPGEPGYRTVASITPWSVSEPVISTSEFDITSGPNNSACPNPPGNQSPSTLPFAPSLTAETTNINAGNFSPLQTTVTREDGQQKIQAVQLRFPPGLSGVLSGVKLCGETEANAGTCGSESLIGSTIVSVGLGGDPFSVTGGKVYFTGPYEGAPFGLSIVNPAVAGPFNLGKVIVRAKIEINPTTAALTVTTDNTGPYKIPSILDGIPLQIKHVNVTIERPGFTFNPTNCSPAQITGTVASTEDASSPVAVPFQVTNCAILKFAPKFAVTTSGKTSKAHGASLSVKLSYPAGSQGTQANITRVKVDLPKQLPSRLTTLQKACTAAQFDTNPAGCPEASVIGHVTVHTPLIPVPLTGPAYFVSHGGEAFPSLIMVLQGYGVTVDLVGTTFISKAGITSSTFKTVPDVPFNTFELTLPEGKYSALAANGVLCTSKLAMPTEFLAQNGAKINQSTPVSVTGCAKKKALARTQKLSAALKTCHKDKSKAKRARCEVQARERYASGKSRKKTTRK